ncbi:MAG: hypothetical protein CBB97_07125 [Candidatus Endolissoclinum sp. TMED37]|nr:MAG: hypothetical protein CBB97_07125 [Candidatus Endolissoclinum sp. TMED37]|tara:strand:- start:355 stop:549 length:195 start_codon:yes stop_codon:yes gene_type:complete
MKHELSREQTTMLRETGVVGPNEIAYILGDLLVIENLQHGTKRTQTHAVVERVLAENNRRILKG